MDLASLVIQFVSETAQPTAVWPLSLPLLLYIIMFSPSQIVSFVNGGLLLGSFIDGGFGITRVSVQDGWFGVVHVFPRQ